MQTFYVVQIELLKVRNKKPRLS